MKKYKNNFFILGIISTVFIVALIFTSKVYAGFGTFGGRYFGGQVVSKIPCLCNVDGGQQVTISGRFGSGTYLENSMTKIYGRGEITIMSHLLGKVTQGGTCITAPPLCEEVLEISEGTIDYTGLASGF